MSLKKDALDIFCTAIEAVKPSVSMQKRVKFKNSILYVDDDSYDLKPYRRVFVFGSGKAGVSMAEELESILDSRLEGGVVVSPDNHKNTKISFLQATHPIPSQSSLFAGKELMKRFLSLHENDFYIYLLSGGSSALIEVLKDGIALEELQATTKNLINSSLSISEINRARKSLSLIKGGGLAQCTKAKGIVLVLSDVVGDDLESIGSAPMLCKNPPKHYFIGSNKQALSAAKIRALQLGFRAEIVTDSLEGDIGDSVEFICEKLESLGPRHCLLFGGESTLHVRGNGKGGRNQHMVLLALMRLKDLKNFAFLSAGSDGIDGNSIAAGAVIDEFTCRDNLDLYLKSFDSYSFFKKSDSLIVTGPTKTNVMDIMIALRA